MHFESPRSYLLILRHYLPSLVIGAYFISLQSVRSIDLSYLLLQVGLVALVLSQPVLRFRLLLNPGSLIAAGLFLSTLICSMVGLQDFTHRAMPLAQIPGILIFLISVLFIREKNQLLFIAWSLLLAISICGFQFWIASYAESFIRGRSLITEAAHPLYLAPNDVLMFAIFLPLVIWCGLQQKNIFGLLLSVGYSALLICLADMLLSRIALLSALLGLLLSTPRRMLGRIVFIIVLAAIFAFFVLLNFDAALLEKLKVHDLDRLRLWVIAWRMFQDAPWLGHGPGSFSTLYSVYLDRFNLAMSFGPDMRHMGWAHSFFFESLAEKGLLGLVVALAYFLYCIGTLMKKRQFQQRGLQRALLSCMVVLLLAASVELSLLRVWAIFAMYLILGLIVVSGRIDQPPLSV